MKKQDLQTGDIIINRGGYLGVIIKEQNILLYQLIGSDDLDEIGDDLTFMDDDYRDGDIMEVCRGVSFLEDDIMSVPPIYRRDEKWVRPTKEEMEKREREREEKQKEREKMLAEHNKEMTEGTITVIAQCFYGNRTATNVRPENINAFLRGSIDGQYYDPARKPVDRKIIPVPGAEHIVIVYDQNQEEKYLTEDFPKLYERIADDYKKSTGKELSPYVSCHIPALGITLHTRCFACRIDENGNFCSLQSGDGEKFIDYFPLK